MKIAEMDRAALDAITKRLTDAGKLVEAGFEGFRIGFIPPDATEAQVSALRKAFMLGAQHLFASMLAIMDADKEPTEDDLRRMSLIDKELREFQQALHH